MSSLLDLPEGEGVSEREGRYITIHITYLVVSCLLPFFCPSRRSVPISVLPLGLSHPTSDLAAGQYRRVAHARREAEMHGRSPSRAAPTRTDSTHVRGCLRDGRPPCLYVLDYRPSSDFVDGTRFLWCAAWWHDLLDELCNKRIAPGLEVPGGIFFYPLGGGALR